MTEPVPEGPTSDESISIESLFRAFSNAPVESSADMRAMAKTTYEFFSAFTAEGFSEGQAIKLCVGILLGFSNE